MSKTNTQSSEGWVDNWLTLDDREEDSSLQDTGSKCLLPSVSAAQVPGTKSKARRPANLVNSFICLGKKVFPPGYKANPSRTKADTSINFYFP